MRTTLAACLLAASIPALADTVTDVARTADGAYAMKIDGQPHVAVTRAQLDAMVKAVEDSLALKERLAKAEQDLAAYRSLTATYEQLRKDYSALAEKYKLLADDSLKLGERYSKAGADLVALNKEYGKLVKDYDALAQKYRDVAVRTAPRHPFDLGLGIVHSNEEDHAVAMAGMGTQLFSVELRGWVFGGPDTYGVMIGTSF